MSEVVMEELGSKEASCNVREDARLDGGRTSFIDDLGEPDAGEAAEEAGVDGRVDS